MTQIEGNSLKSGIVGFWGIVFFSVVAMAPGSIYLLASTTSLVYAGEAAPLTFIVGTVLMFFNVIAVYIYTTKVANAGGFYKFVEKATRNSTLARITAWIQFLGQMLPFVIGATVFAWLIDVSANVLFGIALPIYVPFLASSLTIVYLFLVTYFGVKVSVRLAIIVGIAQMVFVFIAGVYILLHSSYNTVQVFNIQKSPGGIYGFFVGTITGPVTAYIGYSSVVGFAEEAKFPKTTMKKAIVASLLITAVFETLIMYAITVGTSPSNISAIANTYAPALFLTKQYMGIAFASIVLAVALVGEITSPLTFGSSAARVGFALSRDGFFPRSFSKIHKKFGTPYVSTIFVFIFSLVVSIITQAVLVSYYGVETGFFYSIIFWVVALTFMNLLYHAIVNETLPILMHRLKELNIVKHIIGPTIGTVISGVVFYYTFLGISSPLVYIVPIIIFWLALGIFLAVRKRGVKSPDLDPGNMDSSHVEK
ncbi:MAG: APC family permease [Candidatus Thermoplasmatota archaeon]|jgi:amino acid transporter|nr:APC family permease [Candidatus Thermoplasmatota archaeon]